jgi:hypothetical protein
LRVRHGIAVIGGVNVESMIKFIDAAMGSKSMVVRNNSEESFLSELTMVFEKACESPLGAINIVIERPLSKEDQQILNPLLDDNKVLNAPSGKKIFLAQNMRVILFAKDAKNWSPAFTSRVGIVSVL